MADIKYICKQCGKEAMAPEGQPPECCGEPMEPMDVCTLTETAEQDRPFNEDEPCDDGRAGKRI